MNGDSPFTEQTQRTDNQASHGKQSQEWTIHYFQNVPTLRMKPSGQVSWSYHMALYMSRRSRLVRKAKVMRIRPVIWAATHTNIHLYVYTTSATSVIGTKRFSLFVLLLSTNRIRRHQNKCVSPPLTRENFKKNNPFCRFSEVAVPWLSLTHHCRSWYSASWCSAHTACSSSAAAGTELMSSQWPEEETMLRLSDSPGGSLEILISNYLYYIIVDGWCCPRCSKTVDRHCIHWKHCLFKKNAWASFAKAASFNQCLKKTSGSNTVFFMIMLHHQLISLWNIVCCWVHHLTKIWLWGLSSCIMYSKRCLHCVGWCQGFNLGWLVGESKYSGLSDGAYARKVSTPTWILMVFVQTCSAVRRNLLAISVRL